MADTQTQTPRGSEIVKSWPEPSREATELVLDTYGEPDEATPSTLIWYATADRTAAVVRRGIVS